MFPGNTNKTTHIVLSPPVIYLHVKTINVRHFLFAKPLKLALKVQTESILIGQYILIVIIEVSSSILCPIYLPLVAVYMGVTLFMSCTYHLSLHGKVPVTMAAQG